MFKNVISATILFASALMLSSCDSEGNRTKNLLSIPVESSLPMDIKALNEELVALQSANVPDSDNIYLLVSALRSVARYQSTVIAINRNTRAEVSYEVVLIYDAVPEDDSISGYRYDWMMTEDENSKWKIAIANKSWRCWEGRGHREFSNEPCT